MNLPRHISTQIEVVLAEEPAVVLLGPRQVGKTTMALEIAATRPSLYLDLESAEDRSRLHDIGRFLDARREQLLVLDEVHRMPELFAELRGAIDRGRRAGVDRGRFLLLGSASMDLMRQSESLAGRVSYLELAPINPLELPTGHDAEGLWLRGGYPRSLLARSDATSLRRRTDLVRAYLERETPIFAPGTATESLRRLWTMLAHLQGAPLNTAQLAASLGVAPRTALSYVDLLVDLLMVRRLPAWSGNVGKRLVRAPRLYIRDSGILHALLQLGTIEDVLGHPVAGASWEGHAIEHLLQALPPAAIASWYRTSNGAELDLVVDLPGGERWAFEVKRSRSVAPTRGFHIARADLQPARTWIVTPGEALEDYAPGIRRGGLRPILEEIAT